MIFPFCVTAMTGLAQQPGKPWTTPRRLGTLWLTSLVAEIAVKRSNYTRKGIVDTDT